MVTEARCAICTCFSVSSTLVSTTWQQEMRYHAQYLAYIEAWSHPSPDQDPSGLRDASLPHDYPMDAKTLVMLLSSTKPSWSGGTEGSSWVPTATWPLCHHLLSTSHSIYMEVMLLRHKDILCHVIMKKLQP